jgi:hypothetical protein
LALAEAETAFQWNRHGNGIPVSGWGIFVLRLFCMANLAGLLCDLVNKNRLRNSSRTPPPTTPSNLDRVGEQVFLFTWVAWVFLQDSRGLLVPVITVCCLSFSSVSTTYLVHICFRQYLFLVLFPKLLYLFPLPHKKKMKTNMAPVSSVCFRSVFILTRVAHRVRELGGQLLPVNHGLAASCWPPMNLPIHVLHTDPDWPITPGGHWLHTEL